ncbi:hypothetical protein B9K06_26430, partial [Bacillus sp. OG2]
LSFSKIHQGAIIIHHQNRNILQLQDNIPRDLFIHKVLLDNFIHLFLLVIQVIDLLGLNNQGFIHRIKQVLIHRLYIQMVKIQIYHMLVMQ